MNQEIIDRVIDETKNTLEEILTYATDKGIEKTITAPSVIREYINEIVGFDFISQKKGLPDELDFLEVMSDCNAETDLIEEMPWLVFESLHYLNYCTDQDVTMEAIIDKIVNDALKDPQSERLVKMIEVVDGQDLMADFLSRTRFNEVSLLPTYFADYLNEYKPNGIIYAGDDEFTEKDFIYIINKKDKIQYIAFNETLEAELNNGDILIHNLQANTVTVFSENPELQIIEVSRTTVRDGIKNFNFAFGDSFNFNGESYVACEGMIQQIKWNLFDNDKFKVTEVLLDDDIEPTDEVKIDEPKEKPRNKMKI